MRRQLHSLTVRVKWEIWREWSAKAHVIYSVASHLNLLSLLAYLYEYIIEWPKPNQRRLYTLLCFGFVSLLFPLLLSFAVFLPLFSLLSSLCVRYARARALVFSTSLVLVVLKLVRCLWSFFLLFYSFDVVFFYVRISYSRILSSSSDLLFKPSPLLLNKYFIFFWCVCVRRSISPCQWVQTKRSTRERAKETERKRERSNKPCAST